MKKRNLTLAAAVMASLMAMAQRTPEHHFDFEMVVTDSVEKSLDWDSLFVFFDSWQPGTPPCGLSRIDDEFFVSRQRPLSRIADGDYQVRSDVPAERKMLLWTPADDPTATWKTLPRYCFEGDNFSMWQYITCHGNWTAPWLRVSAGIADAAAKNGVTVGCVMSIPWDTRITPAANNVYSKNFAKLMETDDDGNFKNALKLAKLMKYYGINGLGVNSEFRSTPTMMNKIEAFFADVHKKAESIGWKFEVQWYDLTNDSGTMTSDRGLYTHNEKIFGKGDSIVVDQMFANYNWYSDLLEWSAEHAKDLGRSPYDYYAGFDIQGRALQNNYWQDLIDAEASVGFWGAHTQSLIHQSSTDDGSSDVAIQKAYLKKQELIFSGGNRNPALLPEVRTDCTLSNYDLSTFHGLARLLTAKSTIQTIPFVTRFCLGNGLSYYKDGKVAFASKWYNLGMQDYLPTWRFWITGKDDNVTEDGISSLANAELTWDEAYTGGSSLKLYGATELSRIKLFKTMLTTQPDYELSVTYKLANGTDSHAKLFVALSGDVNNYKEVDLPNVAAENEWHTFKAPLSKLGLKPDDKVAMMGIKLENTPADYQMFVGELALRNPSQSFATVKPQVKEIEVLRGYYDKVDFKMRYASREETGEEKTYNDEVDTWYYEIYFQQKGGQPQLLTSTESWAAYVIGAPIDGSLERQCRFGVRAVSPDGEQGSDISWTEYQDVAYTTPTVAFDADHTIVKPNEEFSVSYADKMLQSAKLWQIVNPVTGEVVAEATDSKSISASIAQVGVYDLVVTDSDGNTTAQRGFVSITPEATGAMPKIESILADKSKAMAGETVSYSYEARKSDGKVSRGVVIADPDMLSIPADTQTGLEFSIGLWFKADKWAHDKDGTNLISKNTIADSWPFNNWGDLWVQVRPEFTSDKTKLVHPANEISFNTLGWENHDDSNDDVVTTGYSVSPGVWNHLVVTQDSALMQKMYLNGRRVAGPTLVPNSTRRELMGPSDSRINYEFPANIYIGGGGVYKAGFCGMVDEVQVWDKALTDEDVLRSMQGYADADVPEELLGYYTFEEKDADGHFPNHGKLAGYAATMVRVEGAAGEDMSTGDYVPQAADNSQPGYPGITGSLDVIAKPDWQLGASADATLVAQNANVAMVAYRYGGAKDVALTLTNLWGADTMSAQGIVEVDGPSGIDNPESVGGFSVYPNPFADKVNFRFAEGGRYMVNVLSESGALVQTAKVDVSAGQEIGVFVTGAKGLYLVQVMRDNALYGQAKVVKK